MARTTTFTKRTLISKANTTIVVATAIGAFIFIFSLVASKALLDQAMYQNRVISAKKKALATLRSDISAVDSLKDSYRSFVDTPQNVLGGNPEGTGDQDGDNAKIVLDALPSRYDFPALATSLEKLITSQGLTIESISGTDEEVTQTGGDSNEETKPVAVPFQVRVNGPYENVKNLIGVFDRSIRPIQVTKVDIASSGQNNASITATIDAQTFYQPEKSLKIRTEVVR